MSVISVVILFSATVIVAGIIGALHLFNILHGEPTSLEGFGLGIDVSILLLILGKLISNFFDLFDENDTEVPPKSSFIKLAYRSWKDKYCIKVKIQ